MDKSLTRYIAKTFQGLETVAAEELKKLGAEDVVLLHRAVEFWGDKALMYKANYCCRTVLRILQPVATFEFNTNEQFYKYIFRIPFEQYLFQDGTFCMHAIINQSIFSNSQYASLLAKDALCDRFREKYNCRPSVDKQYPDVSVDIYVNGNQCSVSLDTSGESLHRRGYKTTRHFAALNEVLAAGLIAISGWQADCDFVDFMCGSATLPIEAAMFAVNMPAAYFRNDFGFMYWKNFDEKLWNKIRNDADNAISEFNHTIYGSDISFRYIKEAKENVKKMKLDKWIKLSIESFEDVKPQPVPSVIIINPPYGERMKIEDVENFYQSVGNVLKQKHINSVAWIITPNKDAMKKFGLRPAQKFKVNNAALECIFYKYEMYQGSKKQKDKQEINSV
ncbi:MAG: class I SAM-dependent RNA methyltransferase [Bacteroidales bacterium]|jgi:putative N6-adenine-specific DNA methylase|nr:class I SAM-dependent RNA methyltransferase [Bacteroidales bacterium]